MSTRASHPTATPPRRDAESLVIPKLCSRKLSMASFARRDVGFVHVERGAADESGEEDEVTTSMRGR